MSSRSGRSQTIRHNYIKIYALTAALCVVTALAVTFTALHLGSFRKNTPIVGTNPPSGNSSATSPAPDISSKGGTSDQSKGPSAAITYIDCDEALKNALNPLLIVDAEHPFDPLKASDLTVIKTTDAPADGVKPMVYTYGNRMNSQALTAFQRLQKNMIDAYGDEGKLFVNISYTSLLTEDLDGFNIGLSAAKCSDKNCTEAGHSDHATGYAVDIRYGDGKELTTGTKIEQTTHLQAVCADYGFIQSWVQNGTLTAGKIQKDTWHFRYVGIPHALYMSKNAIGFDGYMEALRATNFNKRLSVASSDGVSYEMYFIPAAGASTRVPVPTGSTYTISGNGVDGFIVTLTSSASAN